MYVRVCENSKIPVTRNNTTTIKNDITITWAIRGSNYSHGKFIVGSCSYPGGSSWTAASSASTESLPDPVVGSGGAPACMLQLRGRLCQKIMLMIDGANPTVRPLGGHVGSASGDLYPLGVGREYRDHEAS